MATSKNAKAIALAGESHKLIKLRRYAGECSCGHVYETTATDRVEAAADVREQHKAHKTNPTPKATPKAKPRARKAAAK